MTLFLKSDILNDLETASRRLETLPFNDGTKSERAGLESQIRRLEKLLTLAELLDEGKMNPTLAGSGFSVDPKVFGIDGDIDQYLNHAHMYEATFIIQSAPYDGEHAVLCFYRSEYGTLVVRVGMRYPARQVWAALSDENELADRRIEPFVFHRKVVGLNDFAFRAAPIFMPKGEHDSLLSPTEIAQQVGAFLNRQGVKIEDGFIRAEDESFVRVFGLVLDGWWKE